MSRVVLPLAAAALLGCRATAPEAEDRPGAVGDAAWRQIVDLRLGERATFDAGALEVTPTWVGVNEATVIVESAGVRREVRIRTGPGGTEMFHPYRVSLLSTSIAETARIEVTRLR